MPVCNGSDGLSRSIDDIWNPSIHRAAINSRTQCNQLATLSQNGSRAEQSANSVSHGCIRRYYSLPHQYKQHARSSVLTNPFLGDFAQNLKNAKAWFQTCNDEEKNAIVRTLLEECGPAQNHFLSLSVQDCLHYACPQNCQDPFNILPNNVAYKILSYLDPVSLARSWENLTSCNLLWHKLCVRPPWQLSHAGHQKQLASFLEKDCIPWKKVFAERFHLRRNWLKGHCHVRTFEGHTEGISAVQFDDRVIVSSSEKTIKVWNIRTNSPWSVMTLVGHSGTVRCLHLLENKLVSGSSDFTVKVWDLSVQDEWSSIACKVTMVGHSDTVRCVQMDAGKVISGSYDKLIKIWSVKSGECLQTLYGHLDHVLCLQFRANQLVSGGADKTIKMWNLTENLCVATLRGHKDAVTCLSFTEEKLVSGSIDCTIKVWFTNTGECLYTLDWMTSEGHTGVIRCLQADSWRIVSAADDRTIKVWCLATGRRLVTLRNHTDGITALNFNDFAIASSSFDCTVKLWDFGVC